MKKTVDVEMVELCEGVANWIRVHYYVFYKYKYLTILYLFKVTYALSLQ